MSATVHKFSQTESFADKVRRLQEEAQAQALHHTRAFEQAIIDLEAVASEIADGGEAYAVGIRAAARRLGVELAGARLNVASLLGRRA
jgi:hypothetical protein